MPKLAQFANEMAPWETDPESGEKFVAIADVCGGFWWAQLHSWAENIRDHGCSDCGNFAVAMAEAMHDLVNVKLGKPLHSPEALALFSKFFQQAVEAIDHEGIQVSEPAHQEYSWADWLGQLAGLQRCGDVHEQVLDNLVAGGPIEDAEAQMLQLWLTCLQDQAFLIPVGDALEKARHELTAIRESGSTEVQELFARYETQLEEHEADPCSRYVWLAKRTHRFRDRATLTLSQFRRLTGKAHPGKANLLKGNLIPWETAVDEVAFDMGMDTDKFERCVLLAYDRQFELFDLLAEVLAKERGRDETSEAAQGNDATQGPRGISQNDAGLLPLCAECVGSESPALLQRSRCPVHGQVQIGLEQESTGAYLKKLAGDTCRSARECMKAILEGGGDESCDAVRQGAGGALRLRAQTGEALRPRDRDGHRPPGAPGGDR